jgi:hypothetical protein
MVSRRNSYTHDFKFETVKLITDGCNSVTQIAAGMGFIPTRSINGSDYTPTSRRQHFPVRGI